MAATTPAKTRRKPARPAPVDVDGVPTEPYEFQHAGKTYYLPSFASLKSGLIRRIRSMEEADAFYTVLEEVATESTLAATDDMDMAELSRVMKGWQKHAGVDLGESSRSSG